MDVALDGDGNVIDNKRVRESLPTIEHLLKQNNHIILVGKIGRPKGVRDPYYSTRRIAEMLRDHLVGHEVNVVEDFLSDEGRSEIKK